MPGPEEALRPDGDGPPAQPTGCAGIFVPSADIGSSAGSAKGGMSTVYLSYDVPGRRAVAVKLLADHLAGQQEFVNRFYREARLSNLLVHPNLIQGHGVGYDQETHKHYLVLEFVDGPTSHTALVRLGRLPVGMAVRIGIDIAQALHFLHARNYVHRDVKPDNILLHPNGVAKLADMGLAKRLSDDSHLTSVNQGVGTSYYMPYEQALNSALVDGRSDIFALGATLYHLLTGQVPFPGATHEEILREKEHDTFVPLRHLNPDVPDELADLVARTLSRDPRARFQDAADLAAALAATGLATRIPSFAPGSAADVHARPDLPGTDAPTRADLTAVSPDPGIPCPDRAGFSPAATPLPTELQDGRFGPDEDDAAGPGSRIIPVIATGAVLLLGLVGFASRPGIWAALGGHHDTVVSDRPNLSPPGVPSGIPH